MKGTAMESWAPSSSFKICWKILPVVKVRPLFHPSDTFKSLPQNVSTDLFFSELKKSFMAVNLVRGMDQLASEVEAAFKDTSPQLRQASGSNNYFTLSFWQTKHEWSSQKILGFLISLLSNSNIKSSYTQLFKTSQHKHVKYFIERYTSL